jgi:hypothetical protein
MSHSITFNFDRPDDENAFALLAIANIMDLESGADLAISSAQSMSYILDYMSGYLPTAVKLLKDCGYEKEAEILILAANRFSNAAEKVSK